MKNIFLKLMQGFVPMLLIIGLQTSCSDKGEVTSSSSPGTTTETGYASLTAQNHPRLLMKTADFDNLKKKINAQTDANLVLLHNTIMNICNEKVMNASTLTYKLDASNLRILDVSRNAILRIFTCAYAYRMTGNNKYLRKAEADINAVCSFEDWNSKRHFLDTAEMATAVAFGYDWLYNELSDATRKKAKDALINFAIKQVIAKNWSQNFYTSTNNWNQVCNGGLVCAALATFESNPENARTIIDNAFESNANALKTMYAPDGNYPEGASYWCYGTLYETLMLSVLDTTIGDDNGLSEAEGFSKTAEYMLYMTGLNNRFFNYSDCSASACPALATWWFAQKQNNPSLLYNELRMLQNGDYSKSDAIRFLPFIMSLANQINIAGVKAPTRKLWSGNGTTPVVLIHTDWSFSDTDKYLGIKGGRASAPHGHMDAGSFVYDAYGVRWSMDLGMQDYTTVETQLKALGGNLWDYSQNSLRWEIFRFSSLNHSTLSINDAKHLSTAMAEITDTICTNTEIGGTLDLTKVLSDQAAAAVRTVKIVDDKDLVVIDEIKARDDKQAKISWRMVTQAIPTVESNRIVLESGSKKMFLKAEGADAISYRTWSTTPTHDYDAANPSTYIVGFETTLPASQSVRLLTTLSPDE